MENTQPLSEAFTNKTFHVPERPSPARIRVLFYDHTAAPSGAEIALLNLVRHLDLAKIEPVVVFGADGPIVEKIKAYAETHILPLPASIGTAKKDTLGASSLLKLWTSVKGIAYIWRLSRLIRAQEIDIVHTNSLKADIVGGLAGRVSGRPVLWHVRDRIDDDYLPSSVARVFRYLCRVIPSYLIACSAATLQSVIPASAGSSRARGLPSRSAVVHDGTVASLAPIRAAHNDELFRIALIGRISPWKGQHIFLEAASVVHTRFPNARFFIVGGALFGESGYEQRVRSLTESLGLSEVVTFTGFRGDVLDVISEMNLIVHASTTGEPFGQVIIEGMAAGKPVVATRGGGVPEIVDDGKTGILVPMNDPKAMAEAMQQIIGDPAFAANMGAQGRKRVLDFFTIERTARKMESVYSLMLSAAH